MSARKRQPRLWEQLHALDDEQLEAALSLRRNGDSKQQPPKKSDMRTFHVRATLPGTEQSQYLAITAPPMRLVFRCTTELGSGDEKQKVHQNNHVAWLKAVYSEDQLMRDPDLQVDGDALCFFLQRVNKIIRKKYYEATEWPSFTRRDCTDSKDGGDPWKKWMDVWKYWNSKSAEEDEESDDADKSGRSESVDPLDDWKPNDLLKVRWKFFVQNPYQKKPAVSFDNLAKGDKWTNEEVENIIDSYRTVGIVHQPMHWTDCNHGGEKFEDKPEYVVESEISSSTTGNAAHKRRRPKTEVYVANGVKKERPVLESPFFQPHLEQNALVQVTFGIQLMDKPRNATATTPSFLRLKLTSTTYSIAIVNQGTKELPSLMPDESGVAEAYCPHPSVRDLPEEENTASLAAPEGEGEKPAAAETAAAAAAAADDCDESEE